MQTILIMSIFCVGMKIVQEPNMILNKPFEYLKKKTPKFLIKPLYECVYCFSSFYGSIAFWSIQVYDKVKHGESLYFHWTILIYWIICTISVVYLNGVLYNGLKHEK